MKGTITPGDTFTKVSKIIEASSLNIEMETQTVLSAEMHVLTEVVKALIISGEKFNSDDALITRAKNITKKILGGGKKDLE